MQRCDECTTAEITMNELSEEYEETENLKFYRAVVDVNEFSHKSTRSDHYPVVRFYPRSKNGDKKTKWVNYKGAITEQVGVKRRLHFRGWSVSSGSSPRWSFPSRRRMNCNVLFV